jgi:putative transcriptional regulator
MNKTTTTVKIGHDRRMMRKTKTGWEQVVREPLSPTPPDFVPAYDPDNLPRTEEQMANAKRVPRVRTLRRQLSLTQEEFAERYQIPVGTLRDWEQHRTVPDATAKAYLKVIAADPEGVATKLSQASIVAAE